MGGLPTLLSLHLHLSLGLGLGLFWLATPSAEAAPQKGKAPAAAPPAATVPAGPAAAAPATPAGGAAAPAASAAPADKPAAAPSQLQGSTASQEAARAHYSRGVDQYLQGSYANAWLEFTSAYQLLPLTALLNNMARCEVKIGRPVEALQHFRRFLAATPDDPDAEYIKQEIARLEAELGRRASAAQVAAAATDEVSPTPPPPRRIPVYSIAAGTTTAVALIAGLATLGAVASRYGSLDTGCKPGCSPMDVSNLQQQSLAGYGLLGAAIVPAILTGVALHFELGRSKETTLRPLAGLRLFRPDYVSVKNRE